MRFQDKVVLVTGAAGVIGSASVRRFISEGALVAIADLNAERAEALATEFGPRARAFPVDVASPAAAEAMVKDVARRFGRIDVLFNNAGISGTVAPIHQLSINDWHNIIDINLNGIFYVLRATLAVMIEGKVQGAVVNMGSSMAGWDVLAGSAGYAATKHGVVGLTRIAALDAAPYGIRVNAICPGVIETRLGVPAEDEAAYQAGIRRFADRIPLRRIGQPEDVAAAVAFLASDDARHVTGVDWLIDGGQTLQSWANAPDATNFPRFV
ncbi:SDR family oxidoreductase [Agrobacterium rhizogenes]|uniref:SDR family NAD(P)-dependent oxidoreductase n=1 Tax=Rhizobium rhizogenes TaxID=359 RepID=UPI000648EDFF|nr:SDR family NAD(P)-dependent oxidoreductase [Rhizobium rhizogenes]NTG05301.1 SDR family oxidoreductase [Rhizobium rhizogenes]NTG11887.1 SDR family oxidoreductase [Rhizobium rhizogenes]NTG90717.1 SDR family oxidoreductase [Rhizobium rhizogenes]NTH23116.1 SDR family oxidoreductase [Rhizobium rhizogenes]NTH36146.1 SDR family oxidoreductase [Rhizobium rhizogenes]